ncbi:MAG TPA: serine/threonine-protein kinase, partial [Polyangiaceae bacterium]|nr:serine/threonine-protein kinase [Polyangiaceae bacterium]
MGDSTSARVHAGEELKVLVPSNGARRVGRYLLCDQIGSGGMATIHLARLLGPQGFSRTVAIKQLHPQFAQNPQFVAMLLDEARLAVRVRHVNVVSPLDIVATESELFIVMDYVSGESLANLLVACDVPLSPAFAAAILVQVLLGLHAAHEATREQGDALGLVHRDVSPQNILVGQDGVTRMVDFGIAKAVARTQTTDGGMVKGKLGYMAPEQIRLEAVDRRTDLFSAGVVLWEALTGTGLFVSDTLGGSIQLILNGEIAPPSRYNPAVTPELDAVVLKALARERDVRFQDALSMASALQRATPVASALELIEWVERFAGPELARRAELVKRAEAVRWEPSQEGSAAPSVWEEPPPSGARPGWAGAVDVS